MIEEYAVICPKEKLDSNKEFLFGIRKALLLTLLEREKIDFNQYNCALELLEKKFKQA